MDNSFQAPKWIKQDLKTKYQTPHMSLSYLRQKTRKLDMSDEIFGKCVKSLTQVCDAMDEVRTKHDDLKVRFYWDLIKYRFLSCLPLGGCVYLAHAAYPEYNAITALKPCNAHSKIGRQTANDMQRLCRHYLGECSAAIEFNFIYPDSAQWVSYQRYPWPFLAPDDMKPRREHGPLGTRF